MIAGSGKAEEAILIPGAMPFKRINPIYPIVAKSYPQIGKHFRAEGSGWQLVEYSQNPLEANRGLADGVTATTAVLEHTSGKVVVIGESMGSMVAWRTAVELAKTDPSGEKDVSFVLIASPDVGISEYFKEGTHIPLLHYRISRVAESPYDTTILVGEYDGWSDPPDRPWNLVSLFNAVMGIAYVHGPPSFTAAVTGLTPTLSERRRVKTYLLPTENLPMTQVFRDVGVPDALVDKADQVLRPIVDAGYVRHDKPGHTRPYLYDGEIHRNAQSQHARESPSNLRVELRRLLRTGVGQLTKRIAERRAERQTNEETG